MNRACFVALLRIDLPAATVRICDGGFVPWDGGTFLSFDPLMGAIATVEPIGESVGEEIPALQMTLIPPPDVPVSDFAAPGFQHSRVRLWVGVKNEETGLIDGTPDLLFEGQIDQASLKLGKSTRAVVLSVVSTLEWLFLRNEGNALSPSWHKRIWPGETGHDNASGLTVPVAWGVESRPVASSAGIAALLGSVAGGSTSATIGTKQGLVEV